MSLCRLMSALVLIISLTAALPLLALQQNRENVSVVGHWQAGPCQAVAFADDLAFIGRGYSLEIVDLSDPGSPVTLGRVQVQTIIKSIALKGNHAFLGCYHPGFLVVDASDPTDPALVGSVDNFDLGLDVEIRGDLAFVTTYWDNLHIIDISDPDHPLEVAHLDPPGMYLKSIVLDGDLAYLGSSNSGLRILDVSDPLNPIEVGSFGPPNSIHDVAIANGHAYLVTGVVGMYILDLTDPVAPVQVGHFNPFQSLEPKLTVNGNHAFLATSGDGLTIVDVTDPAAPVQAGYLQLKDPVQDLTALGDRVYLANEGRGLRIIDVSTPSEPVETGHHNTGGEPRAVAVDGDLAFVAAGSGGLLVVDLSDPAVPVQIGWFDTGHSCNDVATDGDLVYVAATVNPDFQQYVFFIIDPSDPTAPSQVAGLYLGGATAVAIDGNLAFVATGRFGISVIDMTNPATPFVAGDLDIGRGHSSTDVDAEDGLAYLACRDDAGPGFMWIIDVSDPHDPTGITEVYSDYPGYVHVNGDHAYLSGDYLQVVNVADPQAPFQVEFLDFDARGVVIEETFCYVASSAGLDLFDVTDPASPTLIGSGETGGPSLGVDTQGEFAYLADPNQGLWILHNDLLTAASESPHQPAAGLLEAAPNPFNPLTRIGYRLDREQRVDLAVYSVDGRKVRNLVSDPKPAGEHEVTWDGRDARGRPVPSGAYLYRLKTDTTVETKRMSLVR